MNPEYHSILLDIDVKEKKEGITINYDGKYRQWFKLSDFAYSSADIQNFYDIRKDPNNLIKIAVAFQSSRSRSDGYCKLYSNQWERAKGCHVYYSAFIGPKSEKEQMEAIVNEFYGDAMVNITTANLTHEEWSNLWE